MGAEASVYIVKAIAGAIHVCSDLLKERRIFGGINTNMVTRIRNKPNWSALVAMSSDFESWKQISTKMFDDELVTTDRINILKIYTKDVYKKVEPEEKDKIVRGFVLVLKDLKKRKSKDRKNEDLGKTSIDDLLRSERAG